MNTDSQQSPHFDVIASRDRERNPLGGGWDMEFLQLAPGVLQVHFSGKDVGEVRVSTVSASLPCHITGTVPKDCVTILFPARRDQLLRLWGRRIDFNHLIVPGIGQELDVVTASAHRMLCIQTSRAKVIAAAGRFGLTDQAVFGEKTALFRLEAGHADRLRRILEEILLVATVDNNLESRVETRLLLELSSAMASNTYDGTCGIGDASARTRCVKQACEFMENHLHEAVSATDVSGAAGVGVRTLQRCFQEELGVSPLTYAKVRRLNAVRTTLRSATPGKGSVSIAAARFGFTHLGHFGEGYKALFGETPRQTLRNS